jgi:phage baseplate assembly protein gpV
MFDSLLRKIEALESAVNQLDRRLNNSFREGVVKETHHNEGLLTVVSQGLETKKIPQIVQSGAIRTWSPAEVGERVIVLNPTGEPGRGVVLPAGYSDQFPSPGSQGGEQITQIGGVSIKQSSGGVTITAGGVTVSITGSGLHVSGGSVEHDGKNIGKDHRHGDVMAGLSPTGTPI